MKTLIFNGSPRKNGDTAFLISTLATALEGEIVTVNTYFDKISPCVDCRFCWKQEGCAIRDGMQKVYQEICLCDAIVIASPVYFSELTGPLLSVLSRLQTFWCAREFRGEEPIAKPKAGGIILTGGGDGSMKRAEATAKIFLKMMNAEVVGTVSSCNTNTTPARDDAAALQLARELAGKFMMPA